MVEASPPRAPIAPPTPIKRAVPLSSLLDAIKASYAVCVCAMTLKIDSAKLDINNKCFFIFSFSLCYYLRPPLIVAPLEREPAEERVFPELRVLPPLRLPLNELLLLLVLRLFTLLEVDLVVPFEELPRPPRSVAVVLVLFVLFVLFERFTSLFVFLFLFSLYAGRVALPFVFLVFEPWRASLPLVLPSR